jgi:alpha-1,3-glucan synthase
MTLVPTSNWTASKPSITRFTPGHDSRILSDGTTVLDISFEFDAIMECDSVTTSIKLHGTTHGSAVPLIDTASVQCTPVDPVSNYVISATSHSIWRWSARLLNVNDGIYQLSISNPLATSGLGTGVSDSFGVCSYKSVS